MLKGKLLLSGEFYLALTGTPLLNLKVFSLNSCRILISYEERISSISRVMVIETSLLCFKSKIDCDIWMKHRPIKDSVSFEF